MASTTTEAAVYRSVGQAMRAARRTGRRAAVFIARWDRVDDARARIRAAGLEAQVTAHHADALRVLRRGRA